MQVYAGVITISDKGFRGEREDKSCLEIIEILKEAGIAVTCSKIIPDEKDQIKETLIDFADKKNIPLILTTGGTGVSPRDVTPDATLDVIDREVPGMAEAMRHASTAITPHGMISRAIVGIRGKTLIVNLPGSPRAVRENLAVILPALRHAVEKINGDEAECAS